jgi:hypothetical protein
MEAIFRTWVNARISEEPAIGSKHEGILVQILNSGCSGQQ